MYLSLCKTATLEAAVPWLYLKGVSIAGYEGDDSKLCCLVIIGLNSRGEKHFLAIALYHVNYVTLPDLFIECQNQ